MPLTDQQKNLGFAHLIAAATGYSLEHPGQSVLAVNKDGKRALLRWAKDAKETLEMQRAQVKAAQELLVAIGDPTGVLYEIFRLKRDDVLHFRKDGSRPALMTVNLRDAAEKLEMVAPLQVTGRQLEQAWERVKK
jgi:hypothetical protein